MKESKVYMKKFIFLILVIFSGVLNASVYDTLRSPSDFYIASVNGEVSFDDAEQYYNEALKIYHNKNCDGLILAHAYLVDYYRYRNRINEALDHLDSARTLIADCNTGNIYILSLYYRYLGSVTNVLGDFDQALKAFSKSVYLLTSNNDTLPEASMALFKKGWFLQSRMRYDSAEVYLEAAYRHIPYLYKQPNVYYLSILSGLVGIYQATVQLDKAIKANETLIDISEKYDLMKNWYMSSSFINLGSIYYYKNELEKAELAYRQALNRLNERYSSNRSTKASILYNMGLVYHKKNNYKAALQYYKDALSFSEDIKENTRSSALLNMADIYFNLDSNKMAAKYYNMSIDTSIKYYGINNIQFAKALMATSDFYMKSGSETKILPLLKRALAIFQKQDPGHPRAVLCRIKLGDYYKEQQPDSALYFYNEGLAEYPTLDSLLSNDSQKLLLEYRVNLELIWLLQRKSLLFFEMAQANLDGRSGVVLLNQALSTIDTTIRLFEKYRNSLSLESSRLFINDNYSELIEAAVMICRQLIIYEDEYKYEHQLYHYIEGYKAAVLSSEIAEASAINDPEFNDSLFLLERRYSRDIATLQNYLHNNQSMSESRGLNSIAREQLIELFIKHEKIQEEIARKFPAFTKLAYQQKIPHVDELQKVLDVDECLIDYFTTDTCLVSCFISKDKFQVKFHSLNEDFNEMVKQVTMQTRNPGNISFSKTDLQPYINNLSQIGNIVLDTMFLKDLHQIIIIPDSYLSILPFGLLLSGQEDELSSLATLPYLIKSYTISYDYSAGLYLENFLNEEKMIPRVGGFAPVYNYPTEESLPVLKDSPQEVVDIARYFDVKSFFRYQATESGFVDEQQNFSILHLAMHTRLDSINSSFNGLIFAPDTINNSDHILSVSEIYNLHIAAGLSVLSGCNSGYGKLAPGEGLLSLARAFYLAGSKSIVMNLWQVEDRVSKEIFDRFYFHLSEGRSRGEALRLAKTDFLKNADPRFHHPHYWGGFVLIGQNSNFLSNFGQRQIILLSGILISILLVLILVKRGVKRK